MAIADDTYFDWPVLPEAPSSLNIDVAGRGARLTWQLHGGNPTGMVVERRNEDNPGRPGKWETVATLGLITSYNDVRDGKGHHVAYRVRAVNPDGKSAYSNIARLQPHL